MTNAEIDRLVAERVMGWSAGEGFYRGADGRPVPFAVREPYRGVFRPTTNPAHWEMVIDKLVSEGAGLELQVRHHGCRATFKINNSLYVSGWVESKGRAVCLAALEVKN